ncbi:hypothetical protein BDP27DRAFT_1257114 [Rhodocollybia butyracea]|uniref:Fungal N-terminal domain-containing protein n=1 Tax=Rhodocollybia butyracea TaxID=206335 RepID=A0A9P5PZE0_9AGAR|nr:hypothetical protein BDP27DRAFT_1257114 [Rhodocollybia butyracea]
MGELFALVSATVSVALQVSNTIEQIKNNRETRQLLAHRITSSLTQLQSESRKISKSSHSLNRAVEKLKADLQRVLEKCRKPENHANAFSARLTEWFSKDSIAYALKDIETQMSHCLQEFGALSSIRIERKLGDHDVQVNRKLDELLQRTTSRVTHQIDKGHKSVGIPLALKASNYPTSPVRSRSDTSTSSASTTNLRFGYLPSARLLKPDSSPKLAPLVHGYSRSTGSLPIVKSDLSVSPSLKISEVGSLCDFQADKFECECKHLRSLKHPSEALIPGRKAVNLRRMAYTRDKNVNTTAALARSLTYLARCLKDVHVDSQLTGRKVSTELITVLSESVELYKAVFNDDKACRMDLATALYNLSVRQSEPIAQKTTSTTLKTHVPFNRFRRSNNLAAALEAAEDAVHHFSILEREDPDGFGMDLANALLNLSFILSDTENHEKALTDARRAVMLAYRFTSTDPHTQERARNVRTLHKALMRVSNCLDNLGRVEDALEAETEANDVLKKPFFVTGS